MKTKQQMNNIFYGISHKRDGQMILQSDDEAVQNREKFFANRGIDSRSIVSTSLAHGTTIVVVTREEIGKVLDETDGLLTQDSKVCLTVTVSDCLPLFFFDHHNHTIGIAHAGWRGVVAGIASKMISSFIEQGSKQEDITVLIGPHIKQCHFEIQEDTRNIFEQYPHALIFRNGKWFVSLEKIIKEELLREGLKENQIQVDPDCTFCQTEYFSFRREHPKKPVSQIAYIYQD